MDVERGPSRRHTAAEIAFVERWEERVEKTLSKRISVKDLHIPFSIMNSPLSLDSRRWIRKISSSSKT